MSERHMLVTARSIVVLLATACAVSLSAQGQPPPKFEVASVKRSAADAAQSVLRAAPGQFQAVNIPLRVIIQQAAEVAPPRTELGVKNPRATTHRGGEAPPFVPFVSSWPELGASLPQCAVRMRVWRQEPRSHYHARPYG